MTQGLEPLDLSRKSYSVICCFLIWCSQWDLGFYRLIVEGEDKLLFREVVSTSPNLTDFGTIVEDIRDFCNYFFHISFNVISKSCNMAARKLAAASVGIGALKCGLKIVHLLSNPL